MKQVHNVRLRVIDSDKETIESLFTNILEASGIKTEDAHISIVDDGTGELYNGDLWLDHQQPVRKLLKLMLEKLPTEQKQLIATEPSEHIDTQTHCFLRLNKKSLQQGEWTLAERTEFCMLRLNIAAFPATKANAEKIVKEIFS